MVSPRVSTTVDRSTEAPPFHSIVVTDSVSSALSDDPMPYPQLCIPTAVEDTKNSVSSTWQNDPSLIGTEGTQCEKDPGEEGMKHGVSPLESSPSGQLRLSNLSVPWTDTPSIVSDQESSPSRITLVQETIRRKTLFLMFFAVALPNAGVVILFSAMGFGVELYNSVAARELSLVGDGLLSGSCLLACILLVMDWWRMPRPLQVATGLVPVVLFVMGTPLKARRYPWAPMLMTLLMMPLSLFALRFFWCPTVRRSQFFGAIASLTFVAAVVDGLLWAMYVLDGNSWNQSTSDMLAAQVQEVYNHVYPQRPIVYAEDCSRAQDRSHIPKDELQDIDYACDQAATLWFLIWMCPVVAIGIDVVLTTFCFFTGVLGQLDCAKSIQRNLTRFILMMAFILSGIYACVTMSATSIRLGSTLMAFFFGAMSSVVLWLVTEVDLSVLVASAKTSKIMQQMITLVQSDWTKALGISVMGVPVAVFFLLNFLCQRCRRLRHARDTNVKDNYTSLGRKVIDVCHKWNWTSILVKVLWLGELFFVLQVGVAKITYIFLSWLNTMLVEASIGIVIGLVYIVGGSMFLLPPVPGLPVYVFAGILLGEKGRQDADIGFWFGCIIAMALSLFTKLCACVGQYMIGYYMGKSIKVQQFVKVDKVPTKAIERILKSRGLNPGKVALLVGGPDWPTSVTCGIIGVNVPQMLLGTLPVIGLLAPCCLAGACMGRVVPGEDSQWSILANAFTAMAAVVNMASMAYAVYTISNTIGKYGEELSKQRPEHAVVADLTRREAAYVESSARVMQWSALSRCWKTVLLTAAILMMAANMIFVCLSELCFRPFSVSSKINAPYEKHGLDRNVFNIILPGGVGALGMFFVGFCLHVLFHNVMAARSRRQYLSEGGVF